MVASSRALLAAAMLCLVSVSSSTSLPAAAAAAVRQPLRAAVRQPSASISEPQSGPQSAQHSSVPGDSLPPSGFFAVETKASRQQLLQEVSLLAADFAQADTSTPAVSGDASGAHYTFSGFRYHVALEEPAVAVEASGTGFDVRWGRFKLLATFDYHVKKSIFGEHGTVAVFTTTGAGAQLDVLLDVNLDAPTVTVSASSVKLSYAKGGVEVFVQCADAICVIPPGDIAQGVADQFNTVFEQSMQKAITASAQQYVNSLSTTVQLPELALDVDLRSQLFQVGNNPVVFGRGDVVPRADPSYEPWTPKIVPPTSFFENPPAPFTWALTNLVAESGLSSAAKAGYMDMTIGEADVPASSPVKMDTGDLFWTMAVPGFKKYPNMNISVTTSVPAGIVKEQLFRAAVIKGKGLAANITLDAAFTLVNSTTKIPAFTAQFGLGAMVGFKVEDDAKARHIVLTPKWSDFFVDSKVLSSKVGAISAVDLTALLHIAISFVAPKTPIAVPWPADFDLPGATLGFEDGFAALGVNPNYAAAVPGKPCGTSGNKCASSLTCCPGYEGGACCVFQPATCCKNYCCPGGWECCNNGDCCEPRTGAVMNSTALPARPAAA